MKKTISLIIASIITAGLLVAVAPSASALTNNDRNYLSAIRDRAPALRGVSARTLVSMAKTVCRTLRSGYTIMDVVSVGIESGVDIVEVTAITAGAVIYYCPDQREDY